MPRIIASLLIFATFIVAPLASTAAPITVPTDLSVGDKYRLAFVTSTTTVALSTNIADYNNFVAAVAAGVPELVALGNNWKAIGSTLSIDARDNTGTNPNVTAGVPLYTLDDTRIADDNADFWDGVLLASLSKTQLGTGIGFAAFVHTGTRSDGTADPSVLGALSGASMHGNTSHSDVRWIAQGPLQTSLSRNLYAMSAELTVIPEPSSIVLVCIGATAVVGWQLRRRRHRKP